MFKLNLENSEEPETKLPSSVGSSKENKQKKKTREFQKKKKNLLSLNDYAKAFDCVDHNKMWKILQEMGIPDHLTCLLRNLYAGQEATITGHGTTYMFPNWERSMSRLYIVTCLFNLYAEFISVQLLSRV